MRMAVACTHATGSPAATASSAVCSSPMTTAHAPSDDGQVSSNRMGSHSIWELITFSTVWSGWCRWASGFRAPLRRSLAATIAPM